jgi:hypothetical protein
MSSPFIEKLARAYYEGIPTVTERVPWDEIGKVSPKWKEQVICGVRALLSAAMEPDEEMLAEADSAIPRFEQIGDFPRLMGRDGALEVWQAMLTKALEE